MKTKTEKILLVICAVMFVLTVVLVAVLLFFNPNKIVANKDKFELDREKYGSFELDSVGEGLFCIDNMRYYPALEIRHPSKGKGEYDIILDYVHKYKFENENLYCYAEDGYAVVYPESNLCKVFVTPPKDMTLDGVIYRASEEEYKISEIIPSEFPENKFVIYLDSFDEFTPYEQKMLKSLK